MDPQHEAEKLRAVSHLLRNDCLKDRIRQSNRILEGDWEQCCPGGMRDSISSLDYGEQMVMRYRVSRLTRKDVAERAPVPFLLCEARAPEAFVLGCERTLGLLEAPEEGTLSFRGHARGLISCRAACSAAAPFLRCLPPP